jgi:hypothetical protein
MNGWAQMWENQDKGLIRRTKAIHPQRYREEQGSDLNQKTASFGGNQI